MEINIRLSDGKVMRGLIISPGEHARAGIIMVHGLGDHTGRYKYLMKKFSENGFAFAGVDLPGHGRSDGKRGHIRSYRVTREMLDILIREYKKTFPGVPVFIYGHSLGGGIVLDYLLNNRPSVKGAIITSPWLKLSFEPPKFKVITARAMNYLIPSLVQPSGLVTDHMSRDKNVVEAYRNDPLVHNLISVSLFCSATTAAQSALKRAAEINIPLLMMHGSDDQITSPGGSREFASANSKTTLKIWEGGYHEIHNEAFKDDVFNEILTWIGKQT
jgi:alpha-beta hydrolase superfamily lysophospholipase